MKFLKSFLMLLICMVGFTAFSFTSEPKQKSETTIVKDFVQNQNFTTVENVKDYTFNNVFRVSSNLTNFVVKESVITTEKYIFDVGWQIKKSYNNLNKNYASTSNYKILRLDNRIRNNC